MTNVGYNLGSAYGSVIISTNVGEAMDRAAQDFDAGIASMSASVKAWGDSLTMMGAQMSVLMSPLRDALDGAIDQALEFDSSMVNVQSVLGITGEELDTMSDQVLALGMNSRQGAQAASKAMYDIAGGVADASTHMSILETSLDVATAGSAELDGVVNALVKTMNIYSLGAEDAAHAGDVFTRMVGMGVGTANEFAAALPPVEGLGKELGLTFDELGSYMAYMSTKSESVAAGGTQLRGVFSKLMNPSKELGDAIASMGYESGKAMVEQEGLVGALKKIQEFGGGSFSGLITDQEALLGAIALTTDGASEFFDTYNSGIEGATEKAKAIQMASPAAQLDLLKSSLNGLSIQVGRELLPILGGLATALQPIVLGFTEWVATHGDLVRIIGGAIAGVSMLGTGLTGLGLALSLAEPLMAAFSVGMTVMTGPIGMVIAGVTALGVAWSTNFLGMRDLLQPVVDRVTDTLDRLWLSIEVFVSDIQEYGILDAILGAFGLGESGAEASGESWIEGVLATFLGAAGEADGAAREMAQSITESIGSIVIPVVNTFQTVSNALDIFKQQVENLGLFDAISTALGKGQDRASLVSGLLMSFGMTQESAQAMSQSIHEAFMRLYGDFLELRRIAVNAMTYFSAQVNAGGDAFDILRSQFQYVLPMLLDFLGISEDTAETIQITLISALDSAESAITHLGDAFDYAIGAIQNIVTEGKSFTHFFTVFEDGSSIIGTFIEKLGMAEEPATALGAAIANAFGSVFDGVSTFISRLNAGIKWAIYGLSQFGESLADGVQPLQALADTVGVMFTNFLWGIGAISDVTQLRTLQQRWIDTISSIANFFEGLWSTFNRFSTIVGSMISYFTSMREAGVGFFEALRNEINLFVGLGLRFVGVSGETADAVQNWLLTAVTNIERLWNAARSVFGSIWGWLQTVWANIGNIDLSGLMDIIGPLYEVGSWLLALTNPISLAWKILTALGVDFVALIEDVAGAISTFFDTLSQGGSLGDALGAVFGADAVTGITDGVNGIISVVQDLRYLLVGIWEFVSPSLTQFGNWFLNDVVPAIADLVTNSLLPALQSIGDFLGQLWEIVGPHLAAFADWFLYTVLPQIEQFISGTVIPAIGRFIDILTRIWNDVSPFLLQLVDWFLNSALPTIISYVENITIPAIQAFIDILKGIWDLVSPVLTSLYNWFITEGLPFIMEQLEAARQSFQELIDKIVAIWTDVQPDLEVLRQGIEDIFKAIDEQILKPAGVAFNQLIAIVQKIWTDVQQAFADFQKGVSDAFTAVDTQAIQPIKTAIQGVIDAFETFWGFIKPHIDNFVKGVNDALGPVIKLINDIKTALGDVVTQSTQGYQTAANVTTEVAAGVASGQYSVFDVLGAAAQSTISELTGGRVKAYATGSDYIQEDGLAYLHEGEAVLTKEENASRGNGGGVVIQIENLYAATAEQAREVVGGLDEGIKELIRHSGGTFGG